jgi:hypothetical protein
MWLFRSDGLNEDCATIGRSQAEFAIRHLQQARRPGLKYLQSAAFTNAEFRQATDPGNFARNLGDLGPFASLKHV